MTGVDVVGMLLKGSFSLLDDRLGASTEEVWRGRAIPGSNKPGFILWHCARILDWTLNSAIRGAPEVVEAAPWRDRFPREALAGFGISRELADRVADETPARDVAGYLSEVRTAAMSWFETQTDESLAAVPPLKANQPRAYLEPAVWAEIEDLDGLPVWQLLLRPAGAHIRRHAGEYDVLAEALRSGVSTLPG